MPLPTDTWVTAWATDQLVFQLTHLLIKEENFAHIC